MASKQHNISKSSKPLTTGTTDDTLQKVQGMVREWLAFRKKLLTSWERDTKLNNNERVEKHYEGVADTFVPMTYSTLETISAALLTADYNTSFVPQDIYKYLKDRLMPGFSGSIINDDGEQVEETEEQYLVRAIQNAVKGGAITDESLDILNAFYDYCWEKGDWDEEVGYGIDDGIQIGNGSWWMSLENGLPKLDNVPFPDCVFSPRSSEDKRLLFGGRRRLVSLKSLKDEEIADPDNPGKTKKRYKDLDKVKQRDVNTTEDKTEKELLEDLLLGSTVAQPNKDGKLDDDDQVELIEIMTDERMYALINRTVLAEDTENFIVSQAKLRGIDTKRLITIPLTIWANNKKKSLLIGRSETSTFWKEQERLNDNTNQKSDAVTQSLLRQKRADPALKSQKNSMPVPGAVIWAAQGQYEPVENDQVPNAAFTEEASIKNNIRETTATDQLVKGVGSTSDVTATEAKIQVAGAGQRTDKKVKKLERGPLKRIARLGLQYIRLFITDPFIVPQKATNGINPRLYDPKKYDYDFEPKVTLTVAAQNQKRQDQKESADNFQIVIKDPTNNLQEAKKILYPKMLNLDKDEINRIVENPNQGMPGLPGAPQPGAVPGAPAPGLPPIPAPAGAPA